MDEYINKTKKIISEKTGLETEEIEMSAYFEDDLNVSELELLEIIEEVEESFHIELMENKDEIETVQDLADLIAEQVD